MKKLALCSFSLLISFNSFASDVKTSAASEYMTVENSRKAIQNASTYFYDNLHVVSDAGAILSVDSVKVEITDSHDYDDAFSYATVEVAWLQKDQGQLISCTWELSAEDDGADMNDDPDCDKPKKVKNEQLKK